MKLTDGTLVSTALRDTLWQRTDTLLTFRKAVLVFNPVSYLRHRKIDILKLSVDSADVYAFRDGTGRANWDILPSADTLASGTSADTTADTVRTVSEISVRHVALRHGSVTFDDRETKVFANIRDAGLRLRVRLGEGHSMLALDFRNRNILSGKTANCWSIAWPPVCAPPSNWTGRSARSRCTTPCSASTVRSWT